MPDENDKRRRPKLSLVKVQDPLLDQESGRSGATNGAVRSAKKSARTPAIVRFLRECPRTVDEFVARFGEPRMDMGNDLARLYSVWKADGTPTLDIDHVMLYANIIRHFVLYVYAKDRQITHVAAVDPTTWRSQDFRPAGNNKLLR